MCFGGHSLHRDDWLKLALAVGAAGTGAGAAGIGPLAGLMGGEVATGAGAAFGGQVAGDAFMPAMEGIGGAVEGDAYLPGALGTGGQVPGDAYMPGMQQKGALDYLRSMKDGAQTFSKVAGKMKMLGLLDHQPTPGMSMQPPGGGGQIPSMPSSAQIDFPQMFQQQPKSPTALAGLLSDPNVQDWLRRQQQGMA